MKIGQFVSCVKDFSKVPFSEQQITLDERRAAVKNLNDNKAPGIDGLMPEFYKMFWEHLETMYYDMLTESFSSGKLPCSTCKSVITLIYTVV